MFGIPFPPLKERMDRFECGARVIRALWRGQPGHARAAVHAAPSTRSASPCRPARASRWSSAASGERRTMRIVAEHADEWNTTRVTVDEYAAKRARARRPLPCRRS